MINITVNGKEYDIENASDTVKYYVARIRECQTEMDMITNKMNIYNTAKDQYIKLLTTELEDMDIEDDKDIS